MKVWMIGIGTLMVSMGVAFAYTATVDEYKEAVNHKGCDSIPYSDLRGECKSKAAERDEWCKSKGKFTCEDLDPRALQQQIENINAKLKDLKSQRDDLKDKRSDAKDEDEQKKLDEQIAALDARIEKLEKKVDEMQHRLDEEKHQIEDRIYIGEHCFDARNEVQDKFDHARGAAADVSDEAIKPLAQQLIEHWDKGTDDHKKIIADTKTSLEQCKSFR